MFYITSGTKSDYDKHIVASDREWNAKIQYYYNGSWANSLSALYVKSFQLSDYSTDGSNISMGTLVGGKLSLNLMRITKSITSRLTQGTHLKIQLTLNSSKASSSVTLTSAVFIVDDKKLTLRKGNGTYDISLTAYDISYKMTDKYVGSNNKLSAKEILAEIGNKYGFNVGNSVENTIAEYEDSGSVQLTTTEVLEGTYLGTTGQWMDDEGSSYTKNTGMVEVTSNKAYEYDGIGISPYYPSVLWYDANRNYLSAEYYSSPTTIVPPSNAKYAIFQSYDSRGNVTLSVTTSSSVTKYAPLADLTCKQTIGYMAGCYGSFAYFDNNMDLQFGWYEQSGDTINSSRVFSGSNYISEMENRTIVMLETGTSNKPIVVPNNAKGYSINFENPYITETQAEAIYNKRIAIGDIEFKIGKLSYKGNPLNSPGTIVTVKDVQNAGSPFFVMKRTLRYDGGLSETIESQGESETTINYKLTSPTQQRINRALSKMEEAIKNATDIITQTKGSVFEFIPIDENDPSLGNSGWKLYSTEIGSNNVILANSSGIGFSSNGGQSMNAAAIYIDEDGNGHINANLINVGELDGSLIKAGTLVVGKDNVSGLNAELQSLLDIANRAKETADTASSDASDALTKAIDVDTVIANWCAENDETLIDGAKIYTGSITAEQIKSGSITADKLNVGLSNSNYAAAEDWDGDTSYLEHEYNATSEHTIKMTTSSTSSEKRLHTTKSFYATKGSKIFLNAIAYADGTTSNTSTYIGIGIAYQNTSDGWTVKGYSSSSGKTLKQEQKLSNSYTVVDDGYYRVEVWFRGCNTNSYLKKMYVAQGVPGEMVINGVISSVNGDSYFDLNNNLLHTNNAEITGGTITIGGEDYATKISGGSLTQHLKDNTLVGGLLPLIIGNDYYQDLYFKENNAKGIRFSKQNSDGVFTSLFEITPTKLLSAVPIVSEGNDFSGLSYQRNYTKNGVSSSAKVEAGVELYDDVYQEVEAKYMRYSTLQLKNYQGHLYWTTPLSSTNRSYITEWIETNGLTTFHLEFYYHSYGFAFFDLVYKTASQVGTSNQNTAFEKFLECRKGDIDKTEGYFSRTFTIPSDAKLIAIAVKPETANSTYWCGWRQAKGSFLLGTQFSASLKLLDASDNEVVRLDSVTSDGEAYGALRVSSQKGESGVLEFGKDKMWFGGYEICGALRDLEERVATLESQI